MLKSVLSSAPPFTDEVPMSRWWLPTPDPRESCTRPPVIWNSRARPNGIYREPLVSESAGFYADSNGMWTKNNIKGLPGSSVVCYPASCAAISRQFSCWSDVGPTISVNHVQIMYLFFPLNIKSLHSLLLFWFILTEGKVRINETLQHLIASLITGKPGVVASVLQSDGYM